MSWVHRRGSVYRFRRAVPERLRPIIEKREIVRTLHTKDAEEAKRVGVAFAAEVARLFSEAEAALKNPAARIYKGVQAWAEDRAQRPRTDDEDETESLVITDMLEKLEDVRTPEAEVERATLKAILERFHGPQEDHKDNPPLSILFDRWRAEREPPLRTWQEWSTARVRFEQAIGGDLPVRKITKDHVRAFKQALVRMPARRRGATLSPASIQKQLNAIKSVLSWAVREGYLDVNPAAGITHARANVANDGGEDKGRLPYDAEDVARIVAALKDQTGARRFLPLIALYTGCRIEEIAGLRVADVKEEAGVRYFDVVPHAQRRLKSRSSRRRLPIHPELVRAGLLDHAKSVPADGLLFPELKAGPHGKLAGAFSKWWARFADGLGITDTRKTFHSFRHTFKDACRRAGMTEEVHDALTGHSGGGVGRRYGRGVPLAVLADAMARVSYGGNLG